MKMPKPPKPSHYDAYEGKWFWTEEDLLAYGDARERHVFAKHGDALELADKLLQTARPLVLNMMKVEEAHNGNRNRS